MTGNKLFFFLLLLGTVQGGVIDLSNESDSDSVVVLGGPADPHDGGLIDLSNDSDSESIAAASANPMIRSAEDQAEEQERRVRARAPRSDDQPQGVLQNVQQAQPAQCVLQNVQQAQPAQGVLQNVQQAQGLYQFAYSNLQQLPVAAQNVRQDLPDIVRPIFQELAEFMSLGELSRDRNRMLSPDADRMVFSPDGNLYDLLEARILALLSFVPDTRLTQGERHLAEMCIEFIVDIFASMLVAYGVAHPIAMIIAISTIVFGNRMAHGKLVNFLLLSNFGFLTHLCLYSH